MLLAGALLVAALFGCAPSASAQDPGAADPLAPLSARFPPRGTTPPTAVSQLSVEEGDEGGDPIVVVGFAQGFPLPADGYAVRASIGDPGAERIRASLVVAGGAPTGTLERGDGTTWEPLGATRVGFDEAGKVRIEVPADVVADRPAIWVEVQEGDTTVAGTPFFIWSELRGDGEPSVLGVSDYGVVTDGQLAPTGDIVQLDGGPTVAYANGSVTISFPTPPPTDVRGNPVVTVIDYLRFGPEPLPGGLPPFYVTIDHTARQVLLWDGRSGLPVAVPADPATWVTQGFPPPDPAGAPPATEIVLSLDGLALAVGTPVDDPTFGMGLARSAALADARIVTFDGATGLLPWFEGSAAATLPPIEEDIAELAPPTTAARRTADDGGPGVVPWILVGLVAALVVVGVVIWLVRRQDDEGDTFTPIGTARQPAVASEGEGGSRSPAGGTRPVSAAGVSPDEALAALQRTVEEVTSKLDAKVTDRAKVTVPKGDDVARPRSGEPDAAPGDRSRRDEPGGPGDAPTAR